MNSIGLIDEYDQTQGQPVLLSQWQNEKPIIDYKLKFLKQAIESELSGWAVVLSWAPVISIYKNPPNIDMSIEIWNPGVKHVIKMFSNVFYYQI